LLLVAFLLVNAPTCQLSLVLASVVQGDAVNCNMFHHFTINCIWLMLFSHELEQVLLLVKQLTSASSIETFLSSKHYSHGSSFSQLVVCKRRI